MQCDVVLFTRGGVRAPLKFGKENFFGQFICKIRAFSDKNHVKLGIFDNFSDKSHV